MVNSKAVDLIYMETQIHMLLGKEGDVMINATDMAKVFGKDVRNFLKSDSTKNYILFLMRFKNNESFDAKKGQFFDQNEAVLQDNESIWTHYNSQDVKNLVFQTNKKQGTYFCRELALKFASWLDPLFEIWIFQTIDKLLFSEYYQIHRERTAQIAETKIELAKLKAELLNGDSDSKKMRKYINLQDLLTKLQSEKRQAMDKPNRLNILCLENNKSKPRRNSGLFSFPRPLFPPKYSAFLLHECFLSELCELLRNRGTGARGYCSCR